MGERRVVLDERETLSAGGKAEKKPKKKKSCCCSCCIGLVVTFAVIMIASVGVGWYFGDGFVKANFGMSLSECFSVVTGLYSPKEKDIVTNGYTDADLDEFYSDFKKAVFLKDGKNENGEYYVDIDVEDIYDLIMSGDTPSTVAEEENGGQTDALMDYLASLFTKENVDLSRLKYYSPDRHDEFKLTLKDKGLAAVVDKLLGKVFASAIDETTKNELAQYGISDLTNYIKLNQIILSREMRDASVQKEDGSTVKEQKEVSIVKITVQVKVSVLIKDVLTSFGAGAASFAANGILPNNVYLTVGVGLDADVGVDVRINRIDSEAKADKAFKLVDGIMKFAGAGDKSVKEILRETVESYLNPYLSEAGKYVDWKEVKSGALKVDAFNAVIEAADLNNGLDEQNKITSPDLLTALSNVLTSEAANAVSKESAFNNQHRAPSSADGYNSDYKTVYDPNNTDPATLVNYKTEFLTELTNKYPISLDGKDGVAGTEDDVDFNDLMALFGVGSSDKTLELLDLIDSARIGAIVNESGDITVNVNDRMMGAIVNERLDSMLDGTDLASYDLKLEQVILRETKNEGVCRQYIEVGVTAATGGLVGNLAEGVIGSIVNAFLPERIMISASIDITRDPLNGEYDRTEIRYNDLTAQQTSDTLELVGKIIKELDLNSVIGQIESPVRDMTSAMYDVLGSVKFTQSKIILPDVFDVMSELLFKDEGGVTVVTGEEIRAALRHLIGSSDSGYVKETLGIDGAVENYDGFMSVLSDKYYLKGERTLERFDDIFDVIGTDGFSASNFDLNRLKADTRSISALKPVLTDRELARIFSEAMDGSDNGFSVAGVKIGEENGEKYIKIAAQLNLSGFGEDFAALMPADKVYVVATCYIERTPITGTDGSKSYYTEVTVNTMGGEEKNTLLKMLNRLGAEIDIDSNAELIGKTVYDSFETMKTSLGEGGFTVVNGGVELTDFWSFVARATSLDLNNTEFGETPEKVAENLKAAVQGLYGRDEANNPANYDMAEIVFNAARAYDGSSLETMKQSFEQFPSAENGFTGRMADRDFAGFVARDFADKGATLYELTVVNKDNTNPLALKYREEIAALSGSAADVNKDYMRITVGLKISEMFADGSSAADIKVLDFLPESLLVTLYLDVTDMSALSQTGEVRVNSLSQKESKILFALAGIDVSKLSANIDDAVSVLEKYETATFTSAAADRNAVGAVETKFDMSSFA